MRKSPTTLDDLKTRISEFASARDWDQFHTPKNLAMALSGEAGELLEIFQWLTPDQSNLRHNQKAKGKAREEIADILIYLIRMAEKLDIDPLEAAIEKIIKNEEKYPVDLAKGNAKKYTDFNE